MSLFVTHLRDALAFCSRLVPASRDSAGLADAVPFYPAAGALLGLVAAIPTFFMTESLSWIAAWSYTLLLAWLTRGLHWDGLADLADACGSNASGERFWEIIKDSRIGAFGVMALVFGISGLTLAAQSCIATGKPHALILAPLFGRAMVIITGRLTVPHPVSTLAVLVHPGTRSPAAMVSLILSLSLWFFAADIHAFFLSALLVGTALAILTRIAAKHGGANGDFYGAAIIAGEIAALVACAAV